MENFWKSNENLKFYFKEEFNNDTSKHKVESSNLLNSVWLLFHYDSEFIKLPFEERIDVVKQIIPEIKDYNFDSEEFKNLLKKFFNLVEDRPRKSLRLLEEKMIERDEFIATTKYTPTYVGYVEVDGEMVQREIKSNAPVLDKMLLTTEDLIESHAKIKAIISNVKLETKGQGNSELSLSDKGDI